MSRWRSSPRRAVFAAATGGLLLLAGTALAVEPDEILPDAGLESRARSISAGLRCLVCQNQSIDDSGAPLARDLRLLVRERLNAGDSDAAVVQYVVARYGEFVLLRPRLTGQTLVLWVAPLLMLVVAGLLVWRAGAMGSRPALATAPLTPAEEARLQDVLRDQDPAA